MMTILIYWHYCIVLANTGCYLPFFAWPGGWAQADSVVISQIGTSQVFLINGFGFNNGSCFERDSTEVVVELTLAPDSLSEITATCTPGFCTALYTLRNVACEAPSPITDPCQLFEAQGNTIPTRFVVPVQVPPVTFIHSDSCAPTFVVNTSPDGCYLPWFWYSGGIVQEDTLILETPGSYQIIAVNGMHPGGGCLQDTLIEIEVEGYCCEQLGQYNFEVGSNAPGQEGVVSTSSIFNGGNISNVTILLNGDLVIDTDFEFLDCDIVALAGSHIIVDPNVHLTLSGTHITGCGGMWRGVTAFGNITTQYGTARQSMIADALHGIHFHPDSKSSLTHTDFINNFIGVTAFGLDANGELDLVNSMGLTLDAFFRLEFKQDRDLLPNTAGLLSPFETPNEFAYAGVLFHKVMGGGLILGQVNNTNIFEHLDRGIYLKECSDISIEGANFVHIRNRGNYDPQRDLLWGSAVSAWLCENITVGCDLIESYRECSTFDHCTKGVYFLANMETSGHVDFNTFIDCDNAVTANFCLGSVLKIRHNIVTGSVSNATGMRYIGNDFISWAGNQCHISQQGNRFDMWNASDVVGVWESANSGSTHALVEIDRDTIEMHDCEVGIRVNHSARTDIVETQITSGGSKATGIVIDGGKGNQICNTHINMTNSAHSTCLRLNLSPGNIIKCNTFDNAHVGMGVQGMCNTPGGFRGNTLSNHNTGLRIEADGQLGTQDGRGNLWWTNLMPGQSQGVCMNPLPSTSQFITYSNAVSPLPTHTYRPLVLTSAPGWFFQFPSGVTYTGCQSGAWFCSRNHILNRMSNNPIEDEIANGDIYFENYLASQNWEADKALYAKVLEDSTYLSNPDYVSFKENMEVQSVGFFKQLENQIAENLKADSALKNAFEIKNGQLAVLQNQLALLDSLMSVNNDSIALDSLNDLRTNIKALYSSKEIELNSLEGQIKLQRMQQSDLLKQLNTNITVQEIYEQNQKAVNDLYLTTETRGGMAFTEHEKSAIRNIALQCPLLGGQAVYQARTLLKLGIDSTVFDDEVACLVFGIQWRRSGADPNFVLYPNPTSQGNFTLEWDTKIDGVGKLSVFDMMGRLVVEKGDFDLRIKSINIKANLPSGAYSVTCTDDNGKLLTSQKLIVLP